MSDDLTLEKVADFLTRVAHKEMHDGKPCGRVIWFLSDEDIQMLRWARKAVRMVSTFEKSLPRVDELTDCEAFIGRLVDENVSDGKLVAEPQMSLGRKDLEIMNVAALVVTEFEIKKRADAEKEKRSGNWKGRR